MSMLIYPKNAKRHRCLMIRRWNDRTTKTKSKLCFRCGYTGVARAYVCVWAVYQLKRNKYSRFGPHNETGALTFREWCGERKTKGDDKRKERKMLCNYSTGAINKNREHPWNNEKAKKNLRLGAYDVNLWANGVFFSPFFRFLFVPHYAVSFGRLQSEANKREP